MLHDPLSESQWPKVFKAVSTNRYEPRTGAKPFRATALCDIRTKVGGVLRTGKSASVLRIVVSENRDGWQKVRYVVSIEGVRTNVAATKFIVGPEGICPNHPDGTYMVDWCYEGERLYVKRKVA